MTATLVAPTLSPQQLAVKEFDCSRNLLVSAVAGSGKTFISLKKAETLQGLIAYCSFNSSIAKEVDAKKAKLVNYENITVGTVHKFGKAALKDAFPKSYLDKNRKVSKIKILLETAPNERTGQIGVPYFLRKFVRKAYSLARQQGVGIVPDFKFNDQERWLQLVDHFGLQDCFANANGEIPLDVTNLIKQGCTWTLYVIKEGLRILPEIHDFEDMIYAVLRLNLRVWQYNYVIVDEVQDLNTTRRLLVAKMLAEGARGIFVGDPNQAIYGFTGADADSFNRIKIEFDCVELPLSWSFRSAKNIILFAQQWVPHIEYAPDAIEGISPLVPEGTLTYQQMMDKQLTNKDAILCRNNAPLVALFLDFIKQGIPCHVEGKDLTDKFIETIDRWKAIKTCRALLSKIEKWKEVEVIKAEAKEDEERAAEVTDIADAIMALISSMPNGTVDELKLKITSMFKDHSDEEKEGVTTLTLTSGHKSKGREWDRVFWYGRHKWNPSPFARKDWQREQEKNLQYVMATRARRELYDVFVEE